MPTRRWHIPAIGLVAAAMAVAPFAASSAAAAVRANAAENTTAAAGYVAAGTDLASVSSSWTVPSITCGQSTSDLIGVSLVGTASPIPLSEGIGIIAGCNEFTGLTYQDWYEDGLLPTLLRDTVAAGDSMSATIAQESGADYKLTLTDHTRGWTATEYGGSGPSPAIEAAVSVQPYTIVCEGIDFCFDTWVAEPLAQFGTLHFTGTTIDGAALSAASITQDDLVSSGGTTDATTSTLDSSGENFSVTWNSSN